MSMRAGDRAGQATVELLAIVPLLMLVSLLGFCLLAAGRARELAAHAAAAGAMAVLQDGEPDDAARAALPRSSADIARIHVRGGTVTVTVRPRLPLPVIDRLVTVTQSSHAGAPAHP